MDQSRSMCHNPQVANIIKHISSHSLGDGTTISIDRVERTDGITAIRVTGLSGSPVDIRPEDMRKLSDTLAFALIAAEESGLDPAETETLKREGSYTKRQKFDVGAIALPPEPQ